VRSSVSSSLLVDVDVKRARDARLCREAPPFERLPRFVLAVSLLLFAVRLGEFVSTDDVDVDLDVTADSVD
jgi:hypothetical protein